MILQSSTIIWCKELFVTKNNSDFCVIHEITKIFEICSIPDNRCHQSDVPYTLLIMRLCMFIKKLYFCKIAMKIIHKLEIEL